MAAAGAGGGAAPAGRRKPQYPFWTVYEMNQDNFKSIYATINVKTKDKVAERLITIAADMPINADGKIIGNFCEVFREQFDKGRGLPKFEDIVSRQLEGGNQSMRRFIVVDTNIKQPIAYISIIVGDPLYKSLFRYISKKGEQQLAIGAFIDWTCSFTNQTTKIPRHKTIAAYYSTQAKTFRLNVANFITDSVGQILLDEMERDYKHSAFLEEIIGNTPINHVIFYSFGIPESRARHRKNGKLDACSFMDNWMTIFAQESTGNAVSLPEYFNQPASEGMMYYLYSNDENALQFFIDDGADISQPNGTYPVSHARYFNDDNYSCPHKYMNGGRRRRTYKKRKSLVQK